MYMCESGRHATHLLINRSPESFCIPRAGPRDRRVRVERWRKRTLVGAARNYLAEYLLNKFGLGVALASLLLHIYVVVLCS